MKKVIRQLFKPTGNKINTSIGANDWKNIEYFDESWINRIKLMSKYINEGESVMDLGCGKMWLKSLIPMSDYIPVDYLKRDGHTVVCDFNKHEFPALITDVIFISGCLEYIEDVEWFISEVSSHSKKCIISYCTLESVPNIATRKKRAWKNNLKKERLIEIFNNHSMKLSSQDKFEESNDIFVFEKKTD